MQSLRKMGLRSRLLLVFTIMIIVTVIVGAVGIISLFMLGRVRDDLLTSGAESGTIMDAGYQHILFTSVIMAAVLVVGVILSIVFARQISRSIILPTQKMLSVVEQVGSTGNLSFPEELKRSIINDGKHNDEVGRFSRGFAKMMEDILAKVAVLECAATGDLTQRAPAASEYDTLANATNTLIANLNTMTCEVRTAIDQMSTGIAQISLGAQSLAQSAMEQSTTMEGLMRTIGEVSNQAEDNAKHSQEASDITTAIWGSAEEGRDSMDKMTQAMEEINAASQSISTVMKAIDDIAFQTNILSLNAAVEAARAGQHGRGFAVVADEVRNLATKSASAANDTSALIADTITKSGMGSEIVKDTSEYLNKIMNGVSESTWLLKNIATATAEQNESIEAINKGFGQLTDVVHQNSATAEESAAATEQMSSQAGVLLDLVSRFKTEVRDEALPIARAIDKQSPPPDDFTFDGIMQYDEPEQDRPAAKKAFAEPAAEKAFIEPAAEKAFVGPAAEKAFTEPVAEKAFVEPVVEKEIDEPAAKAFAESAAAKALAEPAPEGIAPENEPAAVDAVNEAPLPKPLPESTVDQEPWHWQDDESKY